MHSMFRVARTCVFCGGKPQRKTNEHVVPRWLIELTGNPKREISIGPLVGRPTDNDTGILRLPFDRLCFPACQTCNERFGQLEARVKPIVTSLLKGQPISAQGFDTLLDWLDKVRVGLWLGYHQYLDRNYWGVNPHFHIMRRVGAADRVLLIYKAAEQSPGLRFVGVNTPAFAHVPSCFTLVVNNLFLLDVSSIFLVAEQVGLPYPESLELMEDEHIQTTLVPGKETISYPLFTFVYDDRCTAIAQGVFSDQLIRSDSQHFARLYDCPYVQSITLRPYKARPVVAREKTAAFYPLEPSLQWRPQHEHELDRLVERNYIQTLRIQNFLIDRCPVSSDTPEETKAQMTYDFSQWVETNNWLISLIVNTPLYSPPRKISRNELCPCGSKTKYKFCCGSPALRRVPKGTINPNTLRINLTVDGPKAS